MIARIKRFGQIALIAAWGLVMGGAPVLLLGSIAPQPPQVDGVSVSWEGMTAIGGLILAVLAIMAMVWRGGRLESQLETARQTADAALEELKATRAELKKEIEDLTKTLDGITRMVYELRGARGRKGGGFDDQS